MTTHESHRVAKAFMDSPNGGIIELNYDWKAHKLPRISLETTSVRELDIQRLPPIDFALESRYYIDDAGNAVFMVSRKECPDFRYDENDLFLVGPFNGWQEGIGKREWRLEPLRTGENSILTLEVPLEKLGAAGETVFKFVTGNHRWLLADDEAPNVVNDGMGNRNYLFSIKRSGLHRFRFEIEERFDLSETYTLIYHGRTKLRRKRLDPGPFLLGLYSDKALGAIVENDSTTFRLFAPRAKWVKVGLANSGDASNIDWILMNPTDGYVWETTIQKNLEGAHYWFRLDGPDGPGTAFDKDFKVLDPYAKATVGREGPGIVVDDKRFPPIKPFLAPAWQDLVILEAHTRDMVAGEIEREAPLGFKDLQSSVESETFYPTTLGVNALELQPIQENDSRSPDEYHWGYMTANYFSPASSYATDPGNASQIQEFRDLVDSIHERDMAVIIDVVYNHVGEPAHLLFIDKRYYFHLEPDGRLTNWSGCGNDLKCDTPMGRRLIIDSLKRFVQFYGVDGFRFDLADLVGKDALVEIENELKAIRPDIILIAEPWSFRGHIGRELKDTGYASWNDGYRESIRSYVLGKLSPNDLFHFITGSPDDYASWPAQTVNYTESHDDRACIDVITEREDFDGSCPTIVDIRRSHMMFAIMMVSIGIPMLHAGQDFLHSKHGVNNTYRRGDLNALNFRRRSEFALSSEYLGAWIAFRKSELGLLLRHYSRASKGFFEILNVEGRNALAMVFNADNSHGQAQLLFAVNPDFDELSLSLGDWAGPWRQLADHDRFWGFDDVSFRNDLDDELRAPPLASGLWLRTLS
ncbi:MAG: glycoside hydrolase family 1 [Opitutaceae bacterium]|nr:glycoside hydrolase family 1 [Opitutaceae bacterium]